MDIDSVFRALSDPSRRAMLLLLRSARLSSGEIAAQFDSTWPTISRHLAILREARLVNAERDGNSIFYSLNATAVEETARHMLTWLDPADLK